VNKVILGLGSNLGDKIGNIKNALRTLNDEVGKIGAVSSAYHTAPVGFEDQPDFVNAVAVLETQLSPEDLLAAIQAIETRLGRRRTIRWGPRVMDIDILFYDDETISLPDLEIPHPRIGERLFVLAPLAEIARDWNIPGIGTAEEAARKLTGAQRCERMEGITLWPALDE